jgi:NAD(P)-dependent dehydrogenase (short-subunit alcohol dehydrogenase family)
MMKADSLSNLSLDGKIAVVTGSTQGLGEAVAHLFVDRGASGIIITGRNADRGAKVKAALEAKGAKVVFVQGELSNIADVRKIMAACDKEFGKIDALVNAGASTDRDTIWDATPEQFDAMFAINVRAPYFLIQDALQLMKKSKTRGTIVNILSMSGHGGQSFIATYCASKAALTGITRNTAASVLKTRIRVNGLNIGWMDSPGEDRIMKTYHGADVDWLKKAEAGRPVGRLIKPDEVARTVGYLSSDESGLMTGSIIDFDQQVLGAGNAGMETPDAAF